MKPAVRGAVYEWLAGVIIGIVPLVAHAIAIGSTVPDPTKEADWLADLLFIVVSTSGGSSVSVVRRLLSGDLEPSRLGKSAIAFSAITVVILVAAATLYGSAAVGHARWWAIWEGGGLLVASLIVSIYFELALASQLSSE